MNSRREFIVGTGAATAALGVKGYSVAVKNPQPRGVSTSTSTSTSTTSPAVQMLRESDLEENFRLISELGFDMVRIGLNY